MINKLRNILVSMVAASALLVPVLLPASAYAAVADCVNGGTGGGISGCLDTGSCAVDDTGCLATADTKVGDIIKLVINILSLVVGVIAVIMIIIGGLKYITSGGDSGNVTSAKNTILYAIVGLIIVALAQIIVRFVLTKVNPA